MPRHGNKRSAPCPHGVLKGPCRPCQNAATRRWAQNNPAKVRNYVARNRERISDTNRRSEYPRQYGITYAEALRMREAQQNLCAICSGAMTDEPRSRTRWVVDHYETPAGPIVRGILHASCNSALGLMNDHDPQALRAAADYVERAGRRTATVVMAADSAPAPAPQLHLALVKP